MKRLFIILAILAIFLIYSLGIRHQSPVLKKPSSLTSSNSSSNAPPSSSSGTQYKDGVYTGSVANAYYGNVQVSVTVTGGKITDVSYLQYPNSHYTSQVISQQALPYLKQEVVQSQNANVQIISGATFTSQAFIQSLTAALSQA